MTIPAVIAVTAASIDFLFGLLVLGVSASPGWRAYRWFAGAAFAAGAYSIGEVFIATGAPDEAVVWAARSSLVAAGVHGSCWYPFTARLEGRRLFGWEKGLIGIALAFCALAVLPGVLVTSRVTVVEIPWAGIAYRDAVPTVLGTLCYAYYCVGLGLIGVRLARRALAGDRATAPQFFGLLILLAAAVSDSLTAARVWQVPYLLTTGFLAVVTAVCITLVLRFVAGARALEESSRKLKEAQEKLVARERLAALGELSAVIAHEVRNPLGVIYNAVAQLRRSLPPRDSNGPLVDMVQEEAERLNRIVASLLEFSRPEDVTLHRVPVTDLLTASARAAVAATGAAESQVRVDAPPDEAVWCDRQMLRQALVNLVENALAAPGRKSPVLLRADRQDGFLRLLVIDDGVGVPAGQEERIFTPFFTTRARGTGLGLAVVRRVAEAHGGTARVEPTPGGGATFVMTLAAGEFDDRAA